MTSPKDPWYRDSRYVIKEVVVPLSVALLGLLGVILGVYLTVYFTSRDDEDQPSPTPPPPIYTATHTTETIEPEATATSRPIPTNSPIPVPVTQTPDTTPGIMVTVHRTGDTVAVCAKTATDLSSFVFNMQESNEQYRLGDYFPQSVGTQPGNCWCIEQTSQPYDPPDVCSAENTKQVAKQGNWRSSTLRIYLHGGAYQEFPAEQQQEPDPRDFTF